MIRKASLLLFVSILLFANNVFAYDVQLQPFKDETNDYSRESVYTLSALGIISGYEDRTFRPNGDLSREAFIKLFAAAAQLDTSAAVSRTPSDVAKTRWSAPYIFAAYERGWINSLLDGKGLFHPTKTITRQEVAMVVGLSLLESEKEETRQQWLSTDWKKERDARAFKDHSAITEAMQPYVYYAAHRGIMEGDSSGFKPAEPLIRKQAAAVIYRLLDKRITEQKIDFTGYYAIESYPAIKQMDKLANVIFGWSHLEYLNPGEAKLNTSSTVNKIPSGYEDVIAAADAAKLTKELMVFDASSNLAQFLKDLPA